MTDTLAAVRANKGQFNKGHTVQPESHSQLKHGMGGRKPHPLYVKWNGIKRRCLNPNDKSYARYGGAGIDISNEWCNFENFYRDMGPTWYEGATIDRIDNSKGYSRENCRWATAKEQLRHKRSVRLYTYEGELLTIPELATRLGMKHKTLYAALRRNDFNLHKILCV